VTRNANGPEYGFGFGIAEASPHQALLAKWARGGTSLAQDWRPPSSGGTVGPLFVESIAAWKSLLTTANLTALYPGYDASAGFEIAGFLWTQGWQDGCVDSMAAEYEKNMANFISDMRAAFNLPKLPFAISVFGVNGFKQSIPRRTEVTQAQWNVANCTLHPELGCGTVVATETRDYWRDFTETGGAINQVCAKALRPSPAQPVCCQAYATLPNRNRAVLSPRRTGLPLQRKRGNV
jgi:hypothetical protein